MVHSIILYKHAHSGKEVLGELEEKIRQCNLTLLEIVALTHAKVQERISMHQQMLSGSITSDEYLRWAVGSDPYAIGMFKILVEYRKPMIPLESFSDQESETIKRRYACADTILKKSLGSLKRGKADQALEEMTAYVDLMIDLGDERDRNMCQRIEAIGQLIADEYPSLKGDMLVLAIMGYNHKPERYLMSDQSFTIRVEESRIRVKQYVGIETPLTTDREELSKLLLIFSLTSAMKSLYTAYEIVDARIRLLPHFSYNVLKELCSNIGHYDLQSFDLAAYGFFRKKGYIRI